MKPRLLVCIPVFGQHDFTRDVIADLDKQDNRDFDVVVIDNRGDYSTTSTERVVRPGKNLGWAGGSNFGFRLGFSEGYPLVMSLNNDTRLSPGFIDGLLDPRLPDDAGIVVPMYDDVTQVQKGDYLGPAADYQPVPKVRRVELYDGTGFILTYEAWLAVGELETRLFGTYSWGADRDLGHRVMEAGFSIYVSELSYMNHLGRKTVEAEIGLKRYLLSAAGGVLNGMRKTGGLKAWRERTMVPVVTIDLPPKSSLADPSVKPTLTADELDQLANGTRTAADRAR
ncbi:glycosyltransferase [Williamsia sp. CHRR-6]|uniref:glycosyltransferase n=1 Tax=Williamsia sp. CHRR-6 TaxID=2835871 RepID=UPI001BDB21D1|nr:glycosyltransferase [Williamsia sp. CHRR-6]MBT0567275.1 glycosyltransferase [Williamsia sp. CHRR-6]